MRNFAWVVLALSCAALVRADEVQIFTPSNGGDAPIFMNGQLVRIDRAAGTITLRTDRGQSVLHVDRQTMARMGSLRAGSNVIVGLSGSGTNIAAERRTVTDVRPTAASTLGRGRVTASASGGAMTIAPSKTSAMGTSSNSTAAGTSANSTVPAARGGESSTMPRPTGSSVDRSSGSTFTNDSLPRPPRVPPSPTDGVNRNPASAGVQPAPGAQPLPGVQGATGVQPVPGAQPLPTQQGASTAQVPGAQPLPATGVTGGTVPNPGLATQPVPGTAGQSGINSGVAGQPANPGMVPQAVLGTGGQTATNAGATGGMSTSPNTAGAATGGGRGGSTSAGGGTSGGTVGGGSPVLGPSVPQLGGVAVGGINSQIPSIPPSAGTLSTPILPLPSVTPETNPPQTPSDIAVVRELGSRDFDMAVAVLAQRAAEVDRAWVAYRSQCVSSTVPVNNRNREWFGVLDGSLIAPTEDVCEGSFNEISRLAQGIEASLDTARDSARRADVLPGRMREVLQRYNLDL